MVDNHSTLTNIVYRLALPTFWVFVILSLVSFLVPAARSSSLFMVALWIAFGVWALAFITNLAVRRGWLHS